MADKKKPEGAQPDAAAGATTHERTLLEQIIFEGKVARDEGNTEQVKYAKEMVGEFVNQILGEHIQSAPDSDKVKLIQERIAQIDELLSGSSTRSCTPSRSRSSKPPGAACTTWS